MLRNIRAVAIRSSAKAIPTKATDCANQMAGAVKFVVALLFCSAASILSGCQTTQPEQEKAALAALETGWVEQRISAGKFSLLAYRPRSSREGGLLAVYIEGDGVAWATSTVRSTDPTPKDDLTLQLALRDPSPNRLYLGRPCQFLSPGALKSCNSMYWTSHRYAPGIVDSLNAAVEQVKIEISAGNIALFGYSGGGGLAVLIAARRSDVVRIVTVAGNLDHVAWTRFHGDNPLDGSKNAADVANAVSGIPQVHFIGRNDKIMPSEIAASYLDRSDDRSNISVVSVAGANHECCWVDSWPMLLRDHVYRAP